MRAGSFEEIRERLEELAREQILNQDPLGYFTATYRSAIINMDIGIYNQRFRDMEAVKKMTLAFANRYFDLVEAHKKEEPLPQSWQLIFKTCRRNKITLIQHLFVIMHVRINLDLPWSLAHTFSADEIPAFEADYKAIGKTLHSFYEDLEEKVFELYDLEKVIGWLPDFASAFPSGSGTAYAYKPLSPLEEVKRSVREILLNYTKQLIRNQRTRAWRTGVEWSRLEGPDRQSRINRIDYKVKNEAKEYVYPIFFLDSVFKQLNQIEIGNVSDKIRILMD